VPEWNNIQYQPDLYKVRHLNDNNNEKIIFTAIDHIMYGIENLPQNMIIRKNDITNNIFTYYKIQKLVSEYKEIVGYDNVLKNKYNKNLIEYHYYHYGIDIRKFYYDGTSLLSMTDIYVIT
jgi:hypothetical protein